MVISSVMGERWAFAPYGIILHFCISFVRGAVKSGVGRGRLPGRVLAAPFQSPRSTIFRTGRLLAPSMPVSSSTFPTRPPHPSGRIRAMMSRIGARGARWRGRAWAPSPSGAPRYAADRSATEHRALAAGPRPWHPGHDIP